MTPEPTPRSGIWPPNGSVVVPVAVIWTTAGLTVAAALTTADESSTAMGCEVCPGAWLPVADPTGRLRAPVLSRTTTVPPDASTADSAAAATIRPMPSGRPRRDTGVGATGSVGAGVGAETDRSAGSSQAERIQSGCGSGGGE